MCSKIYPENTIDGNLKSIANDTNAKNNFLQNLLEINSDFIWESNCNGAYTYASPNTYDMFGYKKEEFIGKTRFEFMSHKESGRVSKIFKQICQAQRPYHCLEYSSVHKNGQPLFIESSGVPIIDAHGRFCGYHGIDRLISRRKRVLFDILQTNFELEKIVEKRGNELVTAWKSIENRENEIENNKLQLEEMNKNLRETNDALCVLARNIDRQKDNLEKRIHDVVKLKILPILKQLKNDKACRKRLAEIGVLELYLEDIIPETEFLDEIRISLSQQEMRILALIKDGLKSQQIADMLYISVETVKTHRRNIRRKLKIQNAKINFASYLKSKSTALKQNE